MDDDAALARLSRAGLAGLPRFERRFEDDAYLVPVLVSGQVAAHEAIALWERFDAARDSLGLHPVIVGPRALPIAGVFELGTTSDHATRARDAIAGATAVDVDALLASRGAAAGVTRAHAVYVNEPPPPGLDVLSWGPYDRPEVATFDTVIIVLVGGARPDVAAHLEIASGVQPPAVDVAVLRYFEQRFGATLFHACEQRLTLRLRAPLREPADLAEAAWAHALVVGGELPEDLEDASAVGGQYWLVAWG